MTPRLLLLVAVITAAFAPTTAIAAEPSHYASIKRDEAFMREGPSYAHKVLWIYHRRFYPMKVIASFDAWRKVRDADGAVGWMHYSQLSDVRTVLFIAVARTAIHADGFPSSKIVAVAEPGVVAKVKACKLHVCEVETGDVEGWVDKKYIWGVDPIETF